MLKNQRDTGQDSILKDAMVCPGGHREEWERRIER